jgi:hypothetical protein
VNTNTSRWRRWFKASGGASVSVEMVCYAALWGLFILAVYFAARFALANLATGSAASDAARAASLSRTLTEAKTKANQAAVSSLGNSGVVCENDSLVDVDLGGFARDPGEAKTVTVTITCRVSMERIVSSYGRAGGVSVDLVSVAESPVDTWRER